MMPLGEDRSLRSLGLLALAGIGGYVLVALRLGEGFAIPVAVISAISAGVMLRGPLGQAIARRLDPQHRADAVAGEEVYGELDELRTRVGELEERLDFTERLLVRARDEGGVVGGPSHE